jgi:hypothetical protein
MARPYHWCLLFAACLGISATVRAQTQTASAQSVLTVTPESCVYKMGDDLAWAQPDFDASSETGWVSALPSPTAVLPSGPYHWSRCRLDLRPLAKTGPVYLQIEELASWEAYVDGERLATFGNLQTGRYFMDVVQRFPIPQRLVDRGTVLVAVRETQRGIPPLSYTPRLSPISAGAEKTLSDNTARVVQTAFANRILQFVCYGLVGTAGIFFLILSGVDGTRRDLLWLGLNCVTLGELRVNEMAQVFLLHYPLWLESLLLALGQLCILAYLQFFFSLTGRKAPKLLLLGASWLVLMLTVADLPTRFLGPRADQVLLWWSFHNPHFLNLHGCVGMLVALAPVFAFWPLWRVPKDMRLICAMSLLWGSGEFVNFSLRLGIFSHLDPTGFGREYRALVTVPAIIVMFFLLARRQRRVLEERAELQSEMIAAQEMQRLLVPKVLDVEPWIAIDVAYRPAKEVGGDFYFCRRTAAGQLVVLGDVSGKGLRAAMMASTVVGALRNEESANPADILTRLNTVVLAANFGGFVTCLCALFETDGRLRFANAGQILPYLNGKELHAENGLPLGMIAGMTYEESSVQDIDGAVTLLTDGVLEARAANGELFGFERMAVLTAKPAAEIADAAQQWGQQDDITVLTVERALVSAHVLSALLS